MHVSGGLIIFRGGFRDISIFVLSTQSSSNSNSVKSVPPTFIPIPIPIIHDVCCEKKEVTKSYQGSMAL